MNVVLGSLAAFVSYVFVAVAIENVIFARALGVSRLLIITDDRSKDTYIFCGLLFIVQLLTTPILFFVEPLLIPLGDLRYYIRPLLYILACAAIYLVIYYILSMTLKMFAEQILEILPVATFNCTVFGTIYLSSTTLTSLTDAIGYTVGCSLGYFFAVFIISEGQKIIFKKEVPIALRGMPIMLIYIGILALAIYGFSGNSVI